MIDLSKAAAAIVDGMSDRAAHRSRIDVGDDFSLVVCSPGSVGRHAHAVPALVVALDGEIRFGANGQWSEAEARLIPANISHQLECGEGSVAVLYWMNPAVHVGASTPVAAMAGLVRDALAEDLRLPCLWNALRTAVPGVGPRVLDRRVQTAIVALRSGDERLQRLDAMAEAVRLSPSRLTHLFQRDLGIPFAKVRAWERLRSVVLHRALGDSLTMAGLAAGFADSSHFRKAFRSMFGISASTVMHKGAHIRVEA